MMTDNQRTIDCDHCEGLYEVCRPSICLSSEILRDILAVIARRAISNYVKERAESTPPPITIPAETFILIMQALIRSNREMELELITQKYDHRYSKLCNQIAAILSRTYIELGDGAEFADDEALLMIRDLLLDFDGTIVSRNRFRRITSRYKSGYIFGNKVSL